MARYLITADPVEALDPTFDLGVCLSEELLRRGVAVDYLDLTDTDPGRPAEELLGTLPARPIRWADREGRPFWELGAPRPTSVAAYDVILHRKDPPVDDRYVAWHRPFVDAPAHILQINRPPAIYELSEHTVQLRFPEHAVPTDICTTPGELVAAVRKQPEEAVCKPMGTYCGIGIEFLSSDVDRAVLEAYWEQWGPEVTVQPFLDEIERTGDLRILVFAEHVLGGVLRVPPPGSRIANLHAGGRAAAATPTERQLEACRVVAAELGREGLPLLGLDFIGDRMTEINFTSPTLVVQLNQVTGRRVDVELIDLIEAERERRTG